MLFMLFAHFWFFRPGAKRDKSKGIFFIKKSAEKLPQFPLMYIFLYPEGKKTKRGIRKKHKQHRTGSF
jgi:hypothetical protein